MKARATINRISISSALCWMPVRANHFRLFHALQRRIQESLFQLEEAVAAFENRAGDFVTVLILTGEDAQDEHFGRAHLELLEDALLIVHFFRTASDNSRKARYVAERCCLLISRVSTTAAWRQSPIYANFEFAIIPESNDESAEPAKNSQANQGILGRTEAACREDLGARAKRANASLALACQQSPAHREQPADDHADADVLRDQVPIVKEAEHPGQDDESAKNEHSSPPRVAAIISSAVNPVNPWFNPRCVQDFGTCVLSVGVGR
jgi:hypothetical protein